MSDDRTAQLIEAQSQTQWQQSGDVTFYAKVNENDISIHMRSLCEVSNEVESG